MIKVILFDMDGVLVDAKEWHYEALNRALALFGYNISRYEHVVTYDGLPTKKKLEMLSQEKRLPRELHTFINEMKQRYTMELVELNCKPLFNHEYALSKLTAEGYKIAVCSNSIKSTVQKMMEKANLMKYLAFYLSNEDVTHAKPSPEIYLKAMGEMGVDPKECLIIEDNENGLKAANASGAHVLKIHDIAEVNYHNINNKILKISEAISREEVYHA